MVSAFSSRLGTSFWPSCAINGAHHLVGPDVRPDYRPPAWLDFECKFCGVHRGFPSRPRMRTTGAAPRAAVEAPVPTVVVQPIPERQAFDRNLLLDATTYVGAGSWREFRMLVQQLTDEPWGSVEAARTLSALGHVDLVYAMNAPGVNRWAVAPSVLYTVGGGEAILAGARSRGLVEWLNSACSELGLELRIEEQDAAPDRVSVANASFERIRELAAAASDADLDVAAIDRPHISYARSLPPILSTTPQFKRASGSFSADFRRYDPKSNEWVEHSGVPTTGAYRFLTRPITYGIVTDAFDGSVIRADNRWGKWIAAAILDWTLLAYEPESQALSVPLGVQLPGLYERADVLSSGLAAQAMAEGRAVYRNCGFINNHL